MERIEQIDRQFTLWLNSFHCPASDAFWDFMSGIKVWIPLYVAVVILLIWRLGWKKGLVCIACIALAFFFTERINNLLKALVERTRPLHDEEMIAAGINVLQEAWGFSFPSGHACNSFGFAVSSSICLNLDKKIDWRWYTAGILIWATLVGISRFMCACHFFGDVLVGSINGILVGALFGYFAVKLSKKYSQQLSA